MCDFLESLKILALSCHQLQAGYGIGFLSNPRVFETPNQLSTFKNSHAIVDTLVDPGAIFTKEEFVFSSGRWAWEICKVDSSESTLWQWMETCISYDI